MAVDLDQTRLHLNYDDPTDTDDDAELEFFIAAANEWVAEKVSDTTPTPVQLGTLELIRHWWETQRGPAAGDLDPDGGLGIRGFSIPTRVTELLQPWLTGTATGSPVYSFPDAATWPDAVC